jgi:hypothetical protein
MSGAYERAGTVGFRCVADAEDDCGTDGRVCGREASPPATKTFHSAPSPTAVFSDWAVFGAAEHGKTGGALSNISKAGVPSAQQVPVPPNPVPALHECTTKPRTHFMYSASCSIKQID